MFVAFYKRNYYTLFIMLVFELVINPLLEIVTRYCMLSCCVRWARNTVLRQS